MKKNNNDHTTAREVAKGLLSIGAVKLRPNAPFTWASGWKSPIYCDNRLTLSYPELREMITERLAAQITENYPEVQAIAGVATAGIPQGALVAAKLSLPFIYVRSKPKGHGMTNLIEGEVKAGQQTVVIEDLISTGGSSLKAVEAIRNAGMPVLGMAAIFTYGFNVADDNFKNADVNLITLSNYNDLIDEALSLGEVANNDIESLQEWRNAPEKWGI